MSRLILRHLGSMLFRSARQPAAVETLMSSHRLLDSGIRRSMSSVPLADLDRGAVSLQCYSSATLCVACAATPCPPPPPPHPGERTFRDRDASLVSRHGRSRDTSATDDRSSGCGRRAAAAPAGRHRRSSRRNAAPYAAWQDTTMVCRPATGKTNLPSGEHHDLRRHSRLLLCRPFSQPLQTLLRSRRRLDDSQCVSS